MSIYVANKLLDAKLKNVAGLPPLNEQNKLFDASSNLTAWCRSTLLPVESVPYNLGPNGRITLQGMYQVDLFYPLGQGTDAAYKMADAITNAFPIGERLSDDEEGVALTIEIASTQAANSAVTKFYCLPVLIRWQVYGYQPR